MLFASLLVGDIDPYTHHPAGNAGGIGTNIAPAEHPARFAARVAVAKLDLKRAAPFYSACDGLPRLHSIVRMNKAEEGCLDPGGSPLRNAEDLFQFRGADEALFHQIPVPDSNAGGFGCKPESILRF